MNEKVTEGRMRRAMDWAYEASLNGLPGLPSVYELADSYRKNGGSKIQQANSLIRWQNSKAGTSGFLSGIGGLITAPVALPANITSVIYIQTRMIAAIALIGGHDLKDDRIQTLVYVCLTGNSAKDILKSTGVVIGNKVAMNAIKKIPGRVLIDINKKVGFRLVTKFGTKGAVNIGRMIPLAGGLIGGTFDLATTNIIGNVARNTFIAS